MPDEPPCLHCQIGDLVQQHMEAGDSVNEILFKIAEVTADVLGGCATYEERKHLLYTMAGSMQDWMEAVAADREKRGIEPYAPVTWN